MVERRTSNREFLGSIPTGVIVLYTQLISFYSVKQKYLQPAINHFVIQGECLTVTLSGKVVFILYFYPSISFT